MNLFHLSDQVECRKLNQVVAIPDTLRLVMFFLLKQSSCQLDEQLVFVGKEILDLSQRHEVLV
jgi:hypothetical protein